MANKRKVCMSCNETKNINNFYSTSNVSIYKDGKIHLCKTCCQDIFEQEHFEGFQKIMKLIDKPIYEDLFKGDYGDYIRQMNSLPNYKLNTYDDSNLFEMKMKETKKTKLTSLSEDEFIEAVEFFGEGYTEQDYIFLTSEYQDYLSRYEVDSKTLEDLIKEICLTQLDIRLKRSAQKSVKEEIKTYQDLLTSANLKPVQESGANAAEQTTFGMLIKKWETERPIPEPEDDIKEKDRISEYLRVWFTGHLMRMLNLDNPNKDEYDKELQKYTVEKEDIEDGDD